MNKPVLFATDDGPKVLRAVEREYTEELPKICAHGGKIRVDSTLGETSLDVRLPIDGPHRGPDDEMNSEVR